MHYPQIYVGNIKEYEGGTISAIKKRQIDGSLMLTSLGFDGDEQAERLFHGGPDRALCHYPREHYGEWCQQFPEQAEMFSPPAFGENISTCGLTEKNVYIGDIFRWNDALIQVTQPRSPCYKLNFHFAIEDLSLLMQQRGLCGWLYRVIASGNVSGSHPLELLTRNSDISVEEAISIAFNMPFDKEQYRRLLSAAGLSASWSKAMQMRVAHNQIEDFKHRLFGHV